MISWEEDQAQIAATVHIHNILTSEAQLTIRFLTNPNEAMTPTTLSVPEQNFNPAREGVTSHNIQEIIPHRYPFLLLDRVYYSDNRNDNSHSGIYGLKNISACESHLLNRYDGHPFLTGSLLVEMIAQMGCVIMLLRPNNKGKLVFFMGIDDAHFHRPIIPGDRLFLVGDVADRDRFGKGMGKIYVGDDVVAEGHIKFATVNS
jgi:3-hydroxyacyl-[acyl-carrier-protein] dehydratase